MYLIESLLLVQARFYAADLHFVPTAFSEYSGLYAGDSAQFLLLLLICFLSESYKILFFTPSLVVLSRILSFAILYL